MGGVARWFERLCIAKLALPLRERCAIKGLFLANIGITDKGLARRSSSGSRGRACHGVLHPCSLEDGRVRSLPERASPR